jgi:acyl dehydratase
MSVTARFYFEDVVLDGVLETPAMTITEAHVGVYAGLTHEPAAPGTVPVHLPLCLTTGLSWRVPQPPLAVLAFMGFEWRMLEAVRVGDTIHSRSRTVTKRTLREGGVVIEERDVINQRGEVVEQGRFTFLVAKRPDVDRRDAKEASA